MKERKTAKGSFWVPSRDHKSIYEHEDHLTEKVLSEVDTSGAFLDVGGNVGLWSIRLAEHFRKGYIVEPVAEHIDCIRANFKKFDINNVGLLPYAASNVSDATADISLHLANSGRSTLSDVDWANKTESVTLKRIDDLIDDKDITFVKIDVEGHELQALRGMTALLERSSPTIFVEIWADRQRQKEKTLRFLDVHGYKTEWKVSDNYFLTRQRKV